MCLVSVTIDITQTVLQPAMHACLSHIRSSCWVTYGHDACIAECMCTAVCIILSLTTHSRDSKCNVDCLGMFMKLDVYGLTAAFVIAALGQLGLPIAAEGHRRHQFFW